MASETQGRKSKGKMHTLGDSVGTEIYFAQSGTQGKGGGGDEP